jgi:homoserine kinase
VGAGDGFEYSGEQPAPQGEGNLVHRGFAAAYAAVGQQPPPVAFEVENPVPLARGLGSSSAALVAGVAAELEGHPDNVGPAVYGGFVVAAPGEDGAFVARSFPLPSDWRLLFGVPAYAVPTSEARAALPRTCTLSDTALTASRAALWVAAVATGDRSLLRAASLDVIHQPHRAPLVPGLLQLIADLRAAGADAAYLSGAGPTVGAVVGEASLTACRTVMAAWVGPGGRVLEPATATGYDVTRC